MPSALPEHRGWPCAKPYASSRRCLWVTPGCRRADAYSEGVPLGPDPTLARAAVESLLALRDSVADAEDDVLACLVVTGEPGPQRVLDDWLDQVADTLRALGETAVDISPLLARYAAEPAEPAEPARVDVAGIQPKART